ncbi:MAG: D-aminoacyl-tRNA deacylase [Bacilli bacterium]|nr:D-aminoacyl-tRNA deacylase [Bacilli bacterium]
MRIIVQRCDKAEVRVEGNVVGKINYGMMLLVSFTYGDTEKEIDYLVNKVLNLRIFDDENGVMNKSILDINGEILSISQFTLYANTSKGNRPSYIDALKGEDAIKLYDMFNEKLKSKIHTETGVFGAEMKVDFINDGPITILLEKENK